MPGLVPAKTDPHGAYKLNHQVTAFVLTAKGSHKNVKSFVREPY